MIKLRIDVTKIDKAKLFKGTKGTYLDLVLHENKNGEDQYGNAGFAAMDTSKEEREAGERGVILGNWRHIGQKPCATPMTQGRNKPGVQSPPKEREPQDGIPFKGAALVTA